MLAALQSKRDRREQLLAELYDVADRIQREAAKDGPIWAAHYADVIREAGRDALGV